MKAIQNLSLNNKVALIMILALLSANLRIILPNTFFIYIISWILILFIFIIIISINTSIKKKLRFWLLAG
jgi:hypothetical protein